LSAATAGLILSISSQDIESVARENGLGSIHQMAVVQTGKEGSLRFVVFAVDGRLALHERISELRLAALNRSLKICEQCGKPGEPVTEGYIATLCPEHTR
jgi:hypothetical protein